MPRLPGVSHPAIMSARLLLLLVTAVVATSLACSGDGAGGSLTPTPTAAPASPTAAASTSPTATACPVVAAACVLASRLQAAIASGNAAAITGLATTTSYACPGVRPMGPGGPYPLCEGAAAGETRTGIGIARRYSEGAALSPAAYQAMLTQILQAVDAQASDTVGAGTMRLLAVSCAEATASPATCPRFGVIFSAILRATAVPPLGIVPGREVLVFFGQQQGSDVRVTETWTGVVMPDEVATLRQGGTLFDLGRVFPYSGQ